MDRPENPVPAGTVMSIWTKGRIPEPGQGIKKDKPRGRWDNRTLKTPQGVPRNQTLFALCLRDLAPFGSSFNQRIWTNNFTALRRSSGWICSGIPVY